MKFPYEQWKITEIGFNPAHLAENESVFSLANGYIGFRGNLEEGPPKKTEIIAESIKGTYINGVYETAPIAYGETAYGYAKNSQTICGVADSKGYFIEADGEIVAISPALTNHIRELDFRTGILSRSFNYETKSGTALAIHMQRLVSQTSRHIAAMRLQIRCVQGECEIKIASGIDVTGKAAAVSDDPRTATGKDTGLLLTGRGYFENGLWTAQRTKNSGMAVACAVTHRVNHAAAAKSEGLWEYTCGLESGQAVIVDKFAAYYSGGADETNSFIERSKEEARTAAAKGFEYFAKEQERFYADFWERTGLSIDGDDATLQGMRFNLFHLVQSAGRDGHTNIAAKGLTGEGYEGHYFWDTEIYVLPFMLHTNPEIAKALLMYRYSILDSARNRAREMGHEKGALYPWRTIGGDECSAYYPAGTAQYHINADIAHAISNYVSFTGDNDFLFRYGAEILAETARLWCSLGFFDDAKGFCVNCVTGPDEYNTLVNNNVYTNMMARENMRAAVSALERLQAEEPSGYADLRARINLSDKEINDWQKACGSMYIPYDPSTQIFPQDEGFMDRKPWPLCEIPKDKFPLLLHYHPLVIYRHKVCKQADLVLAMALLGNQFTLEQKKRNFRYYDALTTHDSSLSKAVFSIIASEIGEREKAYNYFVSTARLDLDNTHKNTKDGLHMANMAGTWASLVQGFAGMRCYDGELFFAPYIPAHWNSYTFRIRFQGRVIQVTADKENSRFKLVSGEPLEISVNGEIKNIAQE